MDIFFLHKHIVSLQNAFINAPESCGDYIWEISCLQCIIYIYEYKKSCIGWTLVSMMNILKAIWGSNLDLKSYKYTNSKVAKSDVRPKKIDIFTLYSNIIKNVLVSTNLSSLKNCQSPTQLTQWTQCRASVFTFECRLSIGCHCSHEHHNACVWCWRRSRPKIGVLT